MKAPRLSTCAEGAATALAAGSVLWLAERR
jgi:hypothetical protein